VSRRRHPRLSERQPRAGLFPGHARTRQAGDHGLRRRGPLQAPRCPSQGGVNPAVDRHIRLSSPPGTPCGDDGNNVMPGQSAGCDGKAFGHWRICMRGIFAPLAVAAVVALAAPAHAQEAWPQRPVTIVVPFAAGGSADLLARILQQHLQAKFGVPFVVENKSGAGGSIGTGFVAKAPADGYTLLVGTVSSIAINAFLYTKLNFDVARDLQPVSLLVRFPNLLFVNPKVPARSVPELI